MLEDLLETTRLPSPRVRVLLREAAGLSIAEMASALGVHRQTLWRWERGHDPKGENRRLYASALESLRKRAGSESS